MIKDTGSPYVAAFQCTCIFVKLFAHHNYRDSEITPIITSNALNSHAVSIDGLIVNAASNSCKAIYGVASEVET